MALTQMRYFMGHDGGKFVFGDRIVEKAAMNTDDTTGYRKSVDGRVVDDNEFNAAVLEFTVLHQFEHQILKIAVKQRIGYQWRLASEAP